MHWKGYAEARGNPPDCEVIITFDPRDSEHPYLRRRIAAYESCGKAVVLRPLDSKRPGAGRRRPAAGVVAVRRRGDGEPK